MTPHSRVNPPDLHIPTHYKNVAASGEGAHRRYRARGARPAASAKPLSFLEISRHPTLHAHTPPRWAQSPGAIHLEARVQWPRPIGGKRASAIASRACVRQGGARRGRACTAAEEGVGGDAGSDLNLNYVIITIKSFRIRSVHGPTTSIDS